jgi:pimeloyl-ACP methyl ester carboxylesterase
MPLAFAACALTCLSCSDNREARSTLVPISPNVSLEVADWGGNGFPIVFLAGLGHTAHVFDEFAPLLTDRHRVLGVTRRGFGRSTRPDSGYTVEILAKDIHAVLTSLGLERVVLVGHSLGGDEMTQFASDHPERVAALVYVEAAYNRITARSLMAGRTAPASELPTATAADSASVSAYREYYARANGVRMPLSEIEAMYEWSPEGNLLGGLTPGWVYDRIVRSLRDPDYSGIGTPALAIYGTGYPVTELFVDYDDRDSTTQAAMRAYHAAAMEVDRFSRDYFRTHMKNGQVLEIPGAGHSLYITHASDVLEAISLFLDEVL